MMDYSDPIPFEKGLSGWVIPMDHQRQLHQVLRAEDSNAS
jgi:hypothetical protein